MTVEVQERILRVVTGNVVNAWNEVVLKKGTVAQCTHDMGSMWLAKAYGTNDIPSMLPKSKCRKLTEKEKNAF